MATAYVVGYYNYSNWHLMEYVFNYEDALARVAIADKHFAPLKHHAIQVELPDLPEVVSKPVEKDMTERRILPLKKHGVSSGYNQGCRCIECTAAHAEYHHEYYLIRKARRARQAEREAA